MMKSQHTTKILFFVTLATAIALFVVVQSTNNTRRTVLTSAAPPVEISVPTVTLPQISVMDSPEGSKTLTLENNKNNGVISYILSISSQFGGPGQQILKREETAPQSLEIPFNSWSPNNAYVFIEETTPTSNDYLVLKSSGDFFPNNLPYVSVQESFRKKVTGYSIADVTGWAAPDLLIINTRAVEGDKKVSFWFDVPSQSFTQLGTYFK